MSLDVYLVRSGKCGEKGTGIFYRENGQIKELSIEEWTKKFPGMEPVVAQPEESDGEVYWRNITHNLGEMANQAGCYEALWRPDEHGLFFAEQLIPFLEAGLTRLKADPRYFKSFNPKNGWGNYDGLIAFIEEYLVACKENPTAKVHVSR